MASAGVLALTTADRQALIPMAAGYLILMAALGLGLRRLYRLRGPAFGAGPRPNRAPATPPAPGQRTGWAAMLKRIAGTVIGGYVLLMAVIVAYFYGVTHVGPGFLEGALSGTALLLGLAAPVFAALSWLAGRRERSKALRSEETGIHE
jgi:type IV secretory pathway VirB2 component (pilin)